MPTPVSWFARGLIFENCTCTLVCPGHMHFSQNCTYERCKGYWAIRVDEGRFGDVHARRPQGRDRLRHAATHDRRRLDAGADRRCPQHRPAASRDGDASSPAARPDRGRSWRASSQRSIRPSSCRSKSTTRTRPSACRSAIGSPASIAQIRGRDRSKPVLFENIFNQIHAPRQVLYRGDTEYDDGRIVVHNSGSHGLSSEFEWVVSAHVNATVFGVAAHRHARTGRPRVAGRRCGSA